MTKTRDAHESEMKTQACFTRCCLLLHMVPKMSVKEAPASCAVTASQAAWGESVWGMVDVTSRGHGGYGGGWVLGGKLKIRVCLPQSNHGLFGNA